MAPKNKLRTIEIWRGILTETEVIFNRRNRGERKYHPTITSLIRLEPHLTNCEIVLGQNYVSISKHL